MNIGDDQESESESEAISKETQNESGARSAMTGAPRKLTSQVQLPKTQ